MTTKKKRRKTHPTSEGASATYACPSCFEPVDTFPDPGGGEEQTYVEDCSLCCRPNVLHVRWDADDGTWSIEATRES